MTASENGDASSALKNMTVYIGMTYIYQSHMNIYRIYIPIDIVILLHVVDSGEPCGSFAGTPLYLHYGHIVNFETGRVVDKKYNM